MLSTRKLKWGILGTNWISSVMAEAIQKSETAYEKADEKMHEREKFSIA